MVNQFTGAAKPIKTRAALWAAVASGAVFMMLEMIMVPVFMGGSPWGPPRMIAAIGMGQGVLPPPATFDIGIMMVAMLIHFGLSVALAFLFAFVARGRGVAAATLMGAVFGLVVYVIAFYGMTAVFPWFAMGRGWIGIFAHAMYGVVLGFAYASMARKAG